MMTHLWVYDGALDAAERVLTLDTEGPSMAADGTMAKYRDVITFNSDDHRVLTSHVLGDDGTWREFMTVHTIGARSSASDRTRRSKEEAIEWVKRCPNPLPDTEAEIEIRQVFEASDLGPALTPELREAEGACAQRWLRTGSWHVSGGASSGLRAAAARGIDARRRS